MRESLRNPRMLSFLHCFIIANYRYKFHACLQTLENKDMFKTEERKGNKEFLKWNPELESVTPPLPKGHRISSCLFGSRHPIVSKQGQPANLNHTDSAYSCQLKSPFE